MVFQVKNIMDLIRLGEKKFTNTILFSCCFRCRLTVTSHHVATKFFALLTNFQHLSCHPLMKFFVILWQNSCFFEQFFYEIRIFSSRCFDEIQPFSPNDFFSNFLSKLDIVHDIFFLCVCL